MIALLFLLLAVCMGLAWSDRQTSALVLFGITVVMSAYWLKFHATTVLTIHL
ncbi:DUF5993 family protein [Ruegeria sediminis]|uniref:DUF5993 family protein n=1 Tax=Ruegeria sediminis TaxID=2583820 RepID=UPI001486DF14|nr:DUF5993 family protein [Ruegeria sediminis]